jgi:hypothetical protein
MAITLRKSDCCFVQITTYPHAVAKARYAYGLLYSAQGDAKSAIWQFQEARAIWLRQGESLFHKHIERELLRVQATL